MGSWRKAPWAVVEYLAGFIKVKSGVDGGLMYTRGGKVVLFADRAGKSSRLDCEERFGSGCQAEMIRWAEKSRLCRCISLFGRRGRGALCVVS